MTVILSGQHVLDADSALCEPATFNLVTGTIVVLDSHMIKICWPFGSKLNVSL